ncbi:hypothetical protein CARUB_v10026538mg [Capsella rubella]|uniref:DUF4283 domain-containing protein n=1 Tax=Capsella rubella TaxID=81985 RepID=R0GA69_9BRAS|nr:uncharacterized protein At4g02000 [Capsella rubella]EOA13479.1 hypothetical protein CARUB_v10026538mg [Capsella rubella]
MADELWDEIQNMALARDDPELFIPHEAYAVAEARNRLSLIARPLNPRAQNLFTVISSLPRTWGLTSRVHGRVLDGTFVQFLFRSEMDLISVQRREPWIFNNWFVAFQRWEDHPDLDFLTSIDLWVQMRGIPLAYVGEETVMEIAQVLGEVIEMDFHEATTTQVAYIRVRIRFGITASLRFFRRVRFDSGESAVIRFQYERLRRICSSCLRFTHHRNYCPYRQPLPVTNTGATNHITDGRERIALHDEIHRSDMNSQSQNSDVSFPAPISQPPRVDTPPLNSNEIAAASPYFHPSSDGKLQNFAVPIPQAPWRRNQASSGSNITPTTEYEINSRVSRKFEVGECSRRHEEGETVKSNEMEESQKRKISEVRKNEAVQTKQKQKVQEHSKGGILKPPKKR